MASFRVGTTSYILPADILPNVRFLAERVQDVELVIFEVDDQQNNLPDIQTVTELSTFTTTHDLSYTVHLPLDLHVGQVDKRLYRSMEKAKSVIERTLPLTPLAYVLHLDGRGVLDYEKWVDQASRSLEMLARWVSDPELIAVENLEGYPLGYLDPILERVPVSRCIDIGHLWVDGHDPIHYLEQNVPRARVIHIHGIGTRDHQSLINVECRSLERVLAALSDAGYTGVLTVEVFNLDDFESSLAALKEAGMPWPDN